MTFEQVKIVWLMMVAQGGRRLYESLVLVDWEEFGTNKKMSMMFGGHWVMGMAFYVATSVAFWVEGIRESNLSFPDSRQPVYLSDLCD